MTQPDRRSAAEWTSFAVAALVLLVVVGLIVLQMLGPQDPAAPAVARDGAVRRSADGFAVPVRVMNAGDRTAADVQVTAAHTRGDTVTEGDQTIELLAGGEEEQLVFVFDEDPTRGELTIRVSGFTVP